jgi:hypothetical protein
MQKILKGLPSIRIPVRDHQHEPADKQVPVGHRK